MKRRAFVIVGAAAIVAVATVLAVTLWPASDPSSDGPFGASSQTSQENCFQIPGQVITYKFEIVQNSGSSDATIQRIGYVNPRNLRVLQTFTIPFNNQTNQVTVGHPGYPPQWINADRVSVIRPGPRYQLVLVTRLTGQDGHADAVVVNYTENGSQYVLRTATALLVTHRSLTAACR